MRLTAEVWVMEYACVAVPGQRRPTAPLYHEELHRLCKRLIAHAC